MNDAGETSTAMVACAVARYGNGYYVRTWTVIFSGNFGRRGGAYKLFANSDLAR